MEPVGSFPRSQRTGTCAGEVRDGERAGQAEGAHGGVGGRAQAVERVLERMRVEMVPLVSDLREVRGEIEKIRKQRDADGLSWTVLLVLSSVVGGILGGLVVLTFCR